MSSLRSQVMDKVISALDSISTMHYVSEVFQNYDAVDPRHFPCCFPIDTNEEHEQFTIGDTSQIMARLNIVVTVYVFSAVGETRRTRTDLIMAINKALLNDSALEEIVLDIQPISVQTDQGTIENYSLWNQEFEITYLYNRTDGG
jgi:hypothetical protein